MLRSDTCMKCGIFQAPSSDKGNRQLQMCFSALRRGADTPIHVVEQLGITGVRE
jgi:hypothetical protein